MNSFPSSNPYWWLKTHTFVITATLRDYLISHAVPEKEAIELSYIQNHVLKLSDRTEVDERGYVGIHHQVWTDKCGGNYRPRINLLESIGELEDDGSYHYLSDLSTPEQRENFVPKCKGYKVPQDKINAGLVRIDYKKKRTRPLRPQILRPTHIPVSCSLSPFPLCSNSDDPALEYLFDCLQHVRVTPELISTCDPVRDAFSKQYLERIHYKAFGLRRAKTARVFQAVIEAPREARENLRHENGERFVDIDIKTCHPHLLLPRFSDPKEKENFYHDLQNDLYTLINPQDDRDKTKRRVCQYLMQRNRNAEWLTDTDVHEYFYKKFPIFWKENLSKDTGLAAYLQGTESTIVTKQLVEYAKDQKLFLITMHDGCLTLAKDKNALISKLKALLKEHTGYVVGVEEKIAAPARAPELVIAGVKNTPKLCGLSAQIQRERQEKFYNAHVALLYNKVEKNWRYFNNKFFFSAPKKQVPRKRGKGMKWVTDWDNVSKADWGKFREGRESYKQGLEQCVVKMKGAGFNLYD